MAAPTSAVPPGVAPYFVTSHILDLVLMFVNGPTADGSLSQADAGPAENSSAAAAAARNEFFMMQMNVL